MQPLEHLPRVCAPSWGEGGDAQTSGSPSLSACGRPAPGCALAPQRSPSASADLLPGPPRATPGLLCPSARSAGKGLSPRPSKHLPPPRMGPVIMHSGWKRAKQPAGHPARRGAHSLTRRGGLRVSRARSAGDSKTKPGLQPRLSRSRGTGQVAQAFRVAGTPKAKCRRRRDRARGPGPSAGRRAAPAQRPAPREGTPWAQRPCRPGPGPLGSVPTPGTRVRGTSVEGVRRGVDRIESFSPLCRRGRPGRLLAAPTVGRAAVSGARVAFVAARAAPRRAPARAAAHAAQHRLLRRPRASRRPGPHEAGGRSPRERRVTAAAATRRCPGAGTADVRQRPVSPPGARDGARAPASCRPGRRSVLSDHDAGKSGRVPLGLVLSSPLPSRPPFPLFKALSDSRTWGSLGPSA